MSGQSSSGKVDWLPGQKDLASQLLLNVLGPQAYGKPSAPQELARQRATQGYYQGAAERGLDPTSGLAQKGAASVARDSYAADEANRLAIINRVLTAPGQQSAGSGGGFCWVADELFGLTDWRTLAARRWCETHDNPFTRLYREHGQTWAEYVRRYTIARLVAWPIWRAMAWLGGA